MDPRPTALVACSLCSWTATHTADTLDEVAEFLSRLFLAHTATAAHAAAVTHDEASRVEVATP